MNADELLVKVNDFLSKLRYDRKPSGLYDPVKYVLSMGGKRIRPVLMLLAYGLFKDDVESIFMPACGLETYHNYTLLHDDLMDNAADMKQFIVNGMPIQRFLAVILCWFLPMNVSLNAVKSICQMCFIPSPKQP